MSPRQKQLLTSIVDQYVKTAIPVGSHSLSEEFGYSPATIRAEMAVLEELGYISHPHTSAGRVPTDRGYRVYVDWLQERAEAVATRQREDRIEHVLDQRIASAGAPEQTVRTAVDSLAELTQNVGVGLMGGLTYMTGLARLFNQPEFMNGVGVHEVARLLDDLEPWLRGLAPHEKLNVYIGQENPVGKASGCSLIISRFESPYSNYSYVGVVGPTRQSYPRVIRLVEHVSQQLEGALNG